MARKARDTVSTRKALQHVSRMSTVVHPVPFPCAVYTRIPGPSTRFLFSYFSQPSLVYKTFPCSLRMRDVQQYHHARLVDGRGPDPATGMRRACFLILVSGDTAQGVSVANANESRPPFLFRGSRYDGGRSIRPPPAFPSEFHTDYLTVHLSSTLAVFERNQLTTVMDIECGLALFPATIHDRDIRGLAAWMDRLITKAAHTSSWVSSDTLLSYNETTLALRRDDTRLAKRKRSRECAQAHRSRE